MTLEHLVHVGQLLTANKQTTGLRHLLAGLNESRAVQDPNYNYIKCVLFINQHALEHVRVRLNGVIDFCT